MDILIPMSGRGSRFSQEGYSIPKPFLDMNGCSMIDRVLDSIDIKGRIILIINGHDVLKYDKVREELEYLKGKHGDIVILEDSSNFQGAAKTALEAREILTKESELVIAYCDQIMDWNSESFLEYRQQLSYDGLLATYKNTEPKDDFLICNKDALVTKLVPKEVVSDIATIGLYYWKKTEIFLDGADRMLRKDIRYNDEYYIGPIFNENIASGYKVGHFLTGVHQVGNPKDFQKYLLTI